MAKGGAGRTYTRDSRGRFSSSPGGGKAGSKAKPAAPARAKRTPAAVKAPKATAKPTAPAKRPAGAPRGPKPAPPPWSPAMKQAAAKAKAQRTEIKGKAKPAANKIAASPRVPGTRDPRLALPKSLTKKGWDYSQYMNRDDAESDRRYFARQWTAAAKKDIQLRAELAAVRKKAGTEAKSAEAKIKAVNAKIRDVDNSAPAKEARKRYDALVAASKQADKRLKAADRRVEASKQRLKEANDRLAGIRADIAQRKADFQKRFGMSYEESIARRGKAKKPKR